MIWYNLCSSDTSHIIVKYNIDLQSNGIDCVKFVINLITNQLYLLQNNSLVNRHTDKNVFHTPAYSVGSLHLTIGCFVSTCHMFSKELKLRPWNRVLIFRSREYEREREKIEKMGVYWKGREEKMGYVVRHEYLWVFVCLFVFLPRSYPQKLCL